MDDELLTAEHELNETHGWLDQQGAPKNPDAAGYETDDPDNAAPASWRTRGLAYVRMKFLRDGPLAPCHGCGGVAEIHGHNPGCPVRWPATGDPNAGYTNHPCPVCGVVGPNLKCGMHTRVKLLAAPPEGADPC